MEEAIQDVTNPKPVVKYEELWDCEVGKLAFVRPIDHPNPFVTNFQVTMTSEVIRVDGMTGEFETVNTIYRPEHEQVDHSIIETQKYL